MAKKKVSEVPEVTSDKIELTEEQKANARSALVMAGVIAPKLHRVRIPPAFEDISLHWVKNAPFFVEFMFRFHFFETKDIPTAGVNCIRGNINFYYNPEFLYGGGKVPKFDDNGHPVIILDKKGDPELDKEGNVQYIMEDRKPLTTKELEGLIIHEIQHLIRLHHERTLEDPQLFNIAGDMLINENIKTLKIGNEDVALPEGGIYLDMITNPKVIPGRPNIPAYKGEVVTEPVYIWLSDIRSQFQKRMQQLIQQSGHGKGQGKGQGQPGKCPSCGGTGKDPSDSSGNTPCPDCNGTGQSPSQGSGQDLFDSIFNSQIDVHSILQTSDELAESTISEVIEAAKTRGWGKMGGNGTEQLKELLKPAAIPWKQLLRRAVSPLIYDYGPYFESTWSRHNRRNIPLPGIRRLSNRLVIGVDTSGSIGTKELQQFFTEIEKIVKDFTQLVVIQWDTTVTDVIRKYKKGSFRKLAIHGRGGTSVQATFDWLVENKLNKYPFINFTDGYFDENYDTHGVKTIWCVTSDQQPPGGKVIHIDLSDK
jgi:predicted metal-dependent peptidase